MTPEEGKKQIPDKIKIYFINQTKKVGGSFDSLFIIKTPKGDGQTQVQVTFERPKSALVDKIEYYFNKEEWIEDLQKL